MQKSGKFVLAVLGVLFILTGLVSAFQPNEIGNVLGYHFQEQQQLPAAGQGPEEQAPNAPAEQLSKGALEFRVYYGGYAIGMGAFLLAAAVFGGLRAGAFAFLALSGAGAAATRFMAMLAGMALDPLYYILFLGEIVISLLGFWGWAAHRRRGGGSPQGEKSTKSKKSAGKAADSSGGQASSSSGKGDSRGGGSAGGGSGAGVPSVDDLMNQARKERGR